MFYRLKLEKIEDKKAYLRDENNELFIWPKFRLPENVEVGDILIFNIYIKDKPESKDAKKVAEAMLDEILNSEED